MSKVCKVKPQVGQDEGTLSQKPQKSCNGCKEDEFYRNVKAKTERFRKSAIPSMIKMLNDCHKRKGRHLKS